MKEGKRALKLWVDFDVLPESNLLRNRETIEEGRI